MALEPYTELVVTELPQICRFGRKSRQWYDDVTMTAVCCIWKKSGLLPNWSFCGEKARHFTLRIIYVYSVQNDVTRCFAWFLLPQDVFFFKLCKDLLLLDLTSEVLLFHMLAVAVDEDRTRSHIPVKFACYLIVKNCAHLSHRMCLYCVYCCCYVRVD
jgi:hypothetical protein